MKLKTLGSIALKINRFWFKPKNGTKNTDVLCLGFCYQLHNKGKRSWKAGSELDLVFEWETFMIDFEMAVLKTIKVEFPNTLVKGCLFHFGQSLFRNFSFEPKKKYDEKLVDTSMSDSTDNGELSTIFSDIAIADEFNMGFYETSIYFKDKY